MPLRLVLFDLDGTLADTAPDITRAVNMALAEAGLPALSQAKVRERVSAGARAIVRAAFTQPPPDAEIAPIVERLFAHYAKRPAAETRPFPGIPELIETIGRGGARWAVVTNKPVRLAEPIVAALGLSPRALFVIGGDSLRERKPHPLPLLEACARVGTAPADALYVGDAEIDVHAARAAGMPVAVAGFGYAPSATEVARWRPDFYAATAAVLDERLAALLPMPAAQ